MTQISDICYICLIYGYLLPTIILFVDFLLHVCCKAKNGERLYSGYMKKQMMMFIPCFNYFWALFTLLDWLDAIGRFLQKHLPGLKNIN